MQRVEQLRDVANGRVEIPRQHVERIERLGHERTFLIWTKRRDIRLAVRHLPPATARHLRGKDVISRIRVSRVVAVLHHEQASAGPLLQKRRQRALLGRSIRHDAQDIVIQPAGRGRDRRRVDDQGAPVAEFRRVADEDRRRLRCDKELHALRHRVFEDCLPVARFDAVVEDARPDQRVRVFLEEEIRGVQLARIENDLRHQRRIDAHDDGVVALRPPPEGGDRQRGQNREENFQVRPPGHYSKGSAEAKPPRRSAR